MNFTLSEDQLALAEAVQKLCAGRFPLEKIREFEGSPTVVFDWEELGASGVFAIRTSEDHGGLGLGMAESVVVFEELGRHLVPGPLIATALAAGLVDGASDGKVVVGCIGRSERLIPHLGSLGMLVVVDDEGLALVDPATLHARPAKTPLDPLTPMWIVDGLPQGDRIGGREGAVGWRFGEALLSSAMCVGIAAATLEMSVDYAKTREQFGRPVGSFQAIKHICADMLVRAELARVALHAAAVISDDPETGDPIRTMAGATLLAVEAAIENGRKCIQVHGGMGFTWEVPAHLYLTRARVLASAIEADMAETVAVHL